MKVLISDSMSEVAADVLKEAGIGVDVKTGLTPDELKSIIGKYDYQLNKISSHLLELRPVFTSVAALYHLLKVCQGIALVGSVLVTRHLSVFHLQWSRQQNYGVSFPPTN